MTIVTADLWPENLVNTDIVPPITILKVQATLLGHKMQNLLEGNVTTLAVPAFGIAVSLFRHVFEIVAPALGGYKYPLLTVDHGVELYPLTITAFDHSFECKNEAEFTNALKEIFAEEQTRRVISVLLAQSKA
jgi:hypothetical protein